MAKLVSHFHHLFIKSEFPQLHIYFPSSFSFFSVSLSNQPNKICYPLFFFLFLLKFFCLKQSEEIKLIKKLTQMKRKLFQFELFFLKRKEFLTIYMHFDMIRVMLWKKDGKLTWTKQSWKWSRRREAPMRFSFSTADLTTDSTSPNTFGHVFL